MARTAPRTPDRQDQPRRHRLTRSHTRRTRALARGHRRRRAGISNAAKTSDHSPSDIGRSAITHRPLGYGDRWRGKRDGPGVHSAPSGQIGNALSKGTARRPGPAWPRARPVARSRCRSASARSLERVDAWHAATLAPSEQRTILCVTLLVTAHADHPECDPRRSQRPGRAGQRQPGRDVARAMGGIVSQEFLRDRQSPLSVHPA
jgi:hypothetical protein